MKMKIQINQDENKSTALGMVKDIAKRFFP